MLCHVAIGRTSLFKTVDDFPYCHRGMARLSCFEFCIHTDMIYLLTDSSRPIQALIGSLQRVTSEANRQVTLSDYHSADLCSSCGVVNWRVWW